MSDPSVEQHIDAVDAYARTLFLRTRQDPDLYALTDAVRQLHVALRHLRVEAADPDSLLAARDTVYAGQLRPLVDSSSATLGLLEDALDDRVDGREGAEAMLRTAGSRLRGEKASLDGFLDAVQLQKSKGAARVVVDDVESGGVALDRIKDKVDEVAKRVFSRRDSGFEDDEDRVWKEFKAELEKEGFSSTVLKKHKDVLRAYIRSLETMSSQTGGPPSVRGMLEYEAESRRATPRPASNKEVVPLDADNAKYSPTLVAQRRSPGGEPPPIPPKEPLPELESSPALPPRRSPSPAHETDDTESVDSMALILTKDIMDMDRVESGMANMHLHPSAQQPALPSSPDPKYLDWHAAETSSKPSTSNVSYSFGDVPKEYWKGLAPDRYGQEIPMTAQWTKINRDLVSPEVLARAGVRYEARPTYVAILGRLSREQIADFARQSADVRAARAVRQNIPSSRYTHQRTDSKSSREDLENDESDLFDESDSTDSDDDGTGTKSYPFIVSPPEKTSPAATVKPKSILKNRNENHVRFDPQPHEMSASKSPAGSASSYREDGSRRRRDDAGGRRHHHHRSGSGEGGDRRKPRSYYDDDREYQRHRRHRGDRERERDREREAKSSKKKAWGQTLGAVGLGGAAVSLLSVLAEAAS